MINPSHFLRLRYVNQISRSDFIFNINILIIVPHVGTLPSWIDEDLWNDPDTKTLRLFFDILPVEDSGTSILNATLKLHIKERTGKPYVFVVKSCQ